MSRIPLVDKLPSPKETVDATFSFAEKLMSAQHAFLSNMVDISMPEPTPTATATVKK
jgi:hypothetical protein